MGEVIKIVMKKGYLYSENPLDISNIYIREGDDTQVYSPEQLYDFLKKNRQEIHVPIAPYPLLIPVLSSRQEKYIRAELKKGLANGLMEIEREEEY